MKNPFYSLHLQRLDETVIFVIAQKQKKNVTFSCVLKKKEASSNFIILQICHLFSMPLCMYVLCKNKFEHVILLQTWMAFMLYTQILKGGISTRISRRLQCTFYFLIFFFFVKIIISKTYMNFHHFMLLYFRQKSLNIKQNYMCRLCDGAIIKILIVNVPLISEAVIMIKKASKLSAKPEGPWWNADYK